MLLGQLYGQFGTLITGFLTADLRMMRHLRIIAILLDGSSHIPIDDLRILAMGHDGQRGGSEDLLKGFPAVHQHVSRRASHKQFDARDTMSIQLREQFHIIVGSAKEERVVHVTLPGRKYEFLFQSLKGGGLRHCVGHVEKSRHATCCRCTALTLDIGLSRQSWLTEMHVIIDDTRQDKTARSIYELVIGCFGSMGFCVNPGNP